MPPTSKTNVGRSSKTKPAEQAPQKNESSEAELKARIAELEAELEAKAAEPTPAPAPGALTARRKAVIDKLEEKARRYGA